MTKTFLRAFFVTLAIFVSLVPLLSSCRESDATEAEKNVINAAEHGLSQALSGEHNSRVLQDLIDVPPSYTEDRKNYIIGCTGKGAPIGILTSAQYGDPKELDIKDCSFTDVDCEMS